MTNSEKSVSYSTNGDGSSSSHQIYNVLLTILEYILIHLKFFYYILEHIFFMIFPREEDVKGEIVLITGAAHGIGKQTALKYASLGATVVCLDINEKLNKETVKEIQSRGGNAHHYVCDVLKRDDIIQVAEKIKNEVGTVSILVNNAGIMPCHSLLQHTDGEIRKMFEINVMAHFWLIQTYLPDMITNNHGHIVALSSCAGLFGLRNLVPYCASKFAVKGLMLSLVEELRHDPRNLNIKFTTIYPYMVDTGLCKRPKIKFPNFMRLVTQEEAAEAIVKAQRRGIEEFAIPNRFLYLHRLSRLFPRRATDVLFDFMEAYVDSDL
ncbi:short-chain dehydrogenase/reductase family 16C member 6 [Condylostylus longicornis]|uniref:short-chain dehydrogenase/reductase family 16C member 6 n=1 Tax=Condylostylus longicornis TaxID=2530218 RepID=UPI00244E11D1|nr:short-chain dehydrogenase/reductase family 16C member 6 [Condylostylus longicornis]